MFSKVYDADGHSFSGHFTKRMLAAFGVMNLIDQNKEITEELSQDELSRLREQYGDIDLSHAGEKHEMTFFDKPYAVAECYRTKQFTCLSLTARLKN